MEDKIRRLPKWAQEHIGQLEQAKAEAEADKRHNEYGAYIEGCHIENTAVKHDENSAQAITAIADALGKNAIALHELAKSMSGSGMEVQFGHGIHLEDVRHS